MRLKTTLAAIIAVIFDFRCRHGAIGSAAPRCRVTGEGAVHCDVQLDYELAARICGVDSLWEHSFSTCLPWRNGLRSGKSPLAPSELENNPD